ncbi:MAG: surface protein [Pirellulaceae bacterium]|nr:MAG: surface protein [Pirellulaceae bacterium]
MIRYTIAAITCSWLWVAVAGAQSQAPAELRVYPPDVELSTARDFQSLVVQAQYANGLTYDVTDQAQFQIGDPKLVRLEGNVLYPVADGQTELVVQYADKSVRIPVQVKHATQDRPISFRLDVMPVFMKAGCNMGSCHGAARGKDGFRLSLFGFDPEGDYYRLTREMGGRRINLAVPQESLLIEKALGKVPHTGGTRFSEDSPLYATLMRWLEAGAPNDPGPTPAVVEVQIFPDRAVLDGQGATQRLTVRARYADGTDRDVTGLAYFMSNNDNAATVSQEGVVTAENRGEAFIMARFETHTIGAHYIALPKGLEFTWQEVPEVNYIDQLVHQKLKKLRIQPSELCSDEEFLRRVTLDVTGLLPTPEEYQRFMSDPSPDKRARWIDELLERKEFVELWVMKWAELLQIRTTNQISYKSMLRYYNWLQDRIAHNVPMDKMVQELLSANGGTFTNPATNYYQSETDTLKVAENVAQVFMGMRIQCAQCHNHPFDRWTMDDYYSFAAFFAQIGRKRGEDPREVIIFNSGSGEVRHPVGNRVMQPKFLGGPVPDVNGRDRREVLAKWLASPENPYFARNLVNIVWAHFFGRGIIHEVDDVRVSNPPSNPELLDELARRFTESHYDFKQLVRDICNSRTYQLSTVTNPTNEQDERNFSHAQPRRLRAEILLDAITQVTETKNKFPGLPLGARAVQIANGSTSTYFLTTFGRATRETVCSCEVVTDPNLSQALHLINGDTIHQKIREGGVVRKLLEQGLTPEQVIEQLYIRCLTRRPTDKERQELLSLVTAQPDATQALEDVFWALLNSREFIFNH